MPVNVMGTSIARLFALAAQRVEFLGKQLGD